jgi:hypothetical protein
MPTPFVCTAFWQPGLRKSIAQPRPRSASTAREQITPRFVSHNPPIGRVTTSSFRRILLLSVRM